MFKIFVSCMAYDNGQSGISDYINNIINELSEDNILDIMILEKDRDKFPVSNSNIDLMITRNLFKRPIINALWHLFVLPYKIRKSKYDFIFLPAGNRRLFYRNKIFTIVTFHDLSQFYIKKKYSNLRMFYIKYIIPFFLKKADTILAVSFNTKNDIIKHYKINEEKIKVSYNGFNKERFNLKKEADIKDLLPELKKKYILYVSRIEHPGKNHLNLIKAYELLSADLKSEYDLVFAGGLKEQSKKVVKYAKKSLDAEKIKFTGFVPDNILPPLYKSASVFALPSFYEGFGIPLVEAMACGIPVLCSDRGALKEVGDEAVIFFEPDDPEEIKEKLELLLSDKNKRKELIDKGLERSKTFSWKKHKDDLLRIYKKSTDIIKKTEKKLSGKTGNLKMFFKKLFFSFFSFFNSIINRIFELLVSLMFFVLFTIPVFIILIFRKILFKKMIFKDKIIFGKNGKKLKTFLFNLNRNYLKNLTLFLYVFFGKLQLAGPRIKSYMSEKRLPGEHYVLKKKPGIFNLYFIRKSSRIDFEGEHKTNLEYLSKKNIFYDTLLILKTFPALFYSQKVSEYKNSINLLEVDFLNISMNEAINHINKKIKNKEKSSFYFVNPDCFNKTFKDQTYLDVLQKGNFVFPDGIGVNIACKILKTPLKQNINGTDMFPFICRAAVKENHSLYLLGAKPGVVEKMKKSIEEKFPGIRIIGCRDGYFDRNKENKAVINKINKLAPDILLIAFGAPVQEKWIHNNFDELNPIILMGVGGLFDFYSGNTKRAPVWMRETGIEWVYRILQEPKRMWKRYVIGNPLFLFRVLKWKKKKEQKNG
jgi:N-acetylglucosaminyldiphosphoundecaprenol N-acetyl-beta-D-mannosaminyltransferase